MYKKKPRLFHCRLRRNAGGVADDDDGDELFRLRLMLTCVGRWGCEKIDLNNKHAYRVIVFIFIYVNEYYFV